MVIRVAFASIVVVEVVGALALVMALVMAIAFFDVCSNLIVASVLLKVISIAALNAVVFVFAVVGGAFAIDADAVVDAGSLVLEQGCLFLSVLELVRALKVELVRIALSMSTMGLGLT